MIFLHKKELDMLIKTNIYVTPGAEEFLQNIADDIIITAIKCAWNIVEHGIDRMAIVQANGRRIRVHDGCRYDRTVIYSAANCNAVFKLYVCDNGEGGVTVMLPEEY
jgi:hypothetical protein